MSVVGGKVGIPIILMHDAEGAVVTVETKAGELIRGLLFEAEDSMNLYLKNAVIHNIHGQKRKVDQIYIRGNQVLFIILPDMLKHAPMFQRIKHWRKYGGAPPEGVGAAVGEAAAILRKVNERRGRGGAFMGGGNRSGHFQYNKNKGNRGGDHNNNNNRGGGPRGGPGGGGYGHYRG